ncbi:hypothetical protein [Aquimarina intermedia]|uniref:Acetyltransferase (GNAT) family protein n=1 Tax=Aquimarina intermedia TaxID=350814 RepID=A0A5S5C7K4_9FLAO|nr:hypothetical protein [Aquimarina intermedia]TYP75159.1 hypothetical protein BD809_103223 [Aquimarina intermedia]
MSENISIKKFTKKDIILAVVDGSFLQNNIDIPFTPAKAAWLVQNSRAEEGDILAVLAYSDHRLISYVALVPDYIQDANGNTAKVSWCNRWWIAHDYKDSILATYTMTEALKSVGNQVVIKFLGKEVEGYYQKQPFATFAERYRYYFIFSLDTDLVIMKFPMLKKFRTMLSWVDSFSKSVTAFINSRKIKETIEPLKYNYISRLDNELWSALAPYLTKDLVPKTKELINWQISNSQYQRTPVANKYPYHCLIASAANQIFNLSFTVKNKNRFLGFISVLVRNKEYNVKYFIPFDGCFEECFGALIENFYSVGTSMLYTENEMLAAAIKERLTTTFIDERKLYALKHNQVALDLSPVVVQDHDGHYL